MPYARPTLTQLRTQALQDIQAQRIAAAGQQVGALLRFSVLRVMAYVQAGFAWLHYGYQDWIARMAVPWTAEDEFLAGWAALRGVTRKAAAAASGPAGGTGGTPGKVLLAATPVNRQDGAPFLVSTAGTVASDGSLSVTLTSVTAGAASDCDVGTTFALAQPQVGIPTTLTATAPFTGGADQERDDALRTRMLQAYANVASGGNAADYVRWALAVPGVTRAWVIPVEFGGGSVAVYIMLDGSEAAYGGFPQGTNGVASAETRAAAATGDQLVVANAIYPLRPVTALVFAMAPAPSPVNFTIADLNPNTAAIQAAIASALTDMFVRVGAPGGALRPDGLPGGKVYQSDWDAAIGAIAGLQSYAVTGPSPDYTAATGALPVLGTITWT